MKPIDITGSTFGLLTVLYRSLNDNFGQAMWMCRCACGSERPIRSRDLRNGRTLSCGCLCREINKNQKTKHGAVGTRLYSIWSGMRSRCKNKSNELYGGAGISVCDEWSSFEPFRAWSLANGYDETKSIDRKKGTLGYSPSNCRWATRSQQNRNTRKRNGTISRYRGVSRMRNRWIAFIGIERKAKVIGYYATELEAALAYDEFARSLNEECVFLNFSNPELEVANNARSSANAAPAYERLSNPVDAAAAAVTG